MSKFDSNPNFQSHKFETPSAAKFGLTSSQLNVAMSSSVSIWELEGLSEGDYYVRHPITPAWEILKMSKEDWEESLKPKVHTTTINNPVEEKLETIIEETKEDEIVVETIEQPVKEKVDKLEKKLKKLTKTKNSTWN
jgi:hypothetical protein